MSIILLTPDLCTFFFKVEEWVDWFENFGDGRGYLHTQALGIYIVHAYAIIANTVLYSAIMFSYEQDIYKQWLPEIVHISGISNKAESEFKWMHVHVPFTG